MKRVNTFWDLFEFALIVLAVCIALNINFWLAYATGFVFFSWWLLENKQKVGKEGRRWGGK